MSCRHKSICKSHTTTTYEYVGRAETRHATPRTYERKKKGDDQTISKLARFEMKCSFLVCLCAWLIVSYLFRFPEVACLPCIWINNKLECTIRVWVWLRARNCVNGRIFFHSFLLIQITSKKLKKSCEKMRKFTDAFKTQPNDMERVQKVSLRSWWKKSQGDKNKQERQAQSKSCIIVEIIEAKNYNELFVCLFV